jgi:HSP20 family protein
MTQWIPTRWRHALAELRENIQRAVERWLPLPHDSGRDETAAWLPVPWKEALTELRTDIHKAVDRWLPKWSNHGRIEEERWLPTFLVEGGPVIDIDETEEEVMVVAEMPGLEKDDFTVEVAGNRLILQGEKKRTAADRGAGYYYAERSYGAFARLIALPCDVEADKAKAKYRNGVLRITFPKTEQAKSRRIRVRVR